MGLDMYLTAEKYLSPYEFDNAGERIDNISAQFPELGDSKVTGITAEVGYWRKANAIHKWFVDNVQEGVDECQKSPVNRANLHALRDAVNEVLADNSKASELLPPEAGFFFGSTALDEYYISDLTDTKKILDNILDNPAFGTDEEPFNGWWKFFYRSSW